MNLFKRRPSVAELKANHDVDGLLKALDTDNLKTVGEVVAALGDLRVIGAAGTLTTLLLKVNLVIEKAMFESTLQSAMTSFRSSSREDSLAATHERIERAQPGMYGLCTALCEALGKMGHGEAVDGLFQTASYPYFIPAARLAAVRALGMLDGGDGQAMLEIMLADEKDQAIRAAIESALSEARGKASSQS